MSMWGWPQIIAAVLLVLNPAFSKVPAGAAVSGIFWAIILYEGGFWQ